MKYTKQELLEIHQQWSQNQETDSDLDSLVKHLMDNFPELVVGQQSLPPLNHIEMTDVEEKAYKTGQWNSVHGGRGGRGGSNTGNSSNSYRGVGRGGRGGARGGANGRNDFFAARNIGSRGQYQQQSSHNAYDAEAMRRDEETFGTSNDDETFGDNNEFDAKAMIGSFDKDGVFRMTAEPEAANTEATSNDLNGKNATSGDFDQPEVLAGPIEWLYRDPNGNVQGPFSGKEMKEWFDAGYFPMSLLMRRTVDTQFRPLSWYFEGCKGSSSPFEQQLVKPLSSLKPKQQQTQHQTQHQTQNQTQQQTRKTFESEQSSTGELFNERPYDISQNAQQYFAILISQIKALPQEQVPMALSSLDPRIAIEVQRYLIMEQQQQQQQQQQLQQEHQQRQAMEEQQKQRQIYEQQVMMQRLMNARISNSPPATNTIDNGDPVVQQQEHAQQQQQKQQSLSQNQQEKEKQKKTTPSVAPWAKSGGTSSKAPLEKAIDKERQVKAALDAAALEEERSANNSNRSSVNSGAAPWASNSQSNAPKSLAEIQREEELQRKKEISSGAKRNDAGVKTWSSVIAKSGPSPSVISANVSVAHTTTSATSSTTPVKISPATSHSNVTSSSVKENGSFWDGAKRQPEVTVDNNKSSNILSKEMWQWCEKQLEPLKKVCDVKFLISFLAELKTESVETVAETIRNACSPQNSINSPKFNTQDFALEFLRRRAFEGDNNSSSSHQSKQNRKR